MGLAPSNSDDLWHVSDVPKKYLTAGMATIIVIEDTGVGTMYHRCEIGDEGYLRPLYESQQGSGYVTKAETSIEGAIPPVDG